MERQNDEQEKEQVNEQASEQVKEEEKEETKGVVVEPDEEMREKMRANFHPYQETGDAVLRGDGVKWPRFCEKGFEIEDSWRIRGKEKKRQILRAIMESDEYKKWGGTRTLESYLAEWRFHNFCWRIGFMKGHAKNAFFDKEFPKTFRGRVEKTIYWVMSWFYRKEE